MSIIRVKSPFLKWAIDNAIRIELAVTQAEQEMSESDPRRIGLYWTIARQLYEKDTTVQS